MQEDTTNVYDSTHITNYMYLCISSQFILNNQDTTKLCKKIPPMSMTNTSSMNKSIRTYSLLTYPIKKINLPLN